jgi:hypothetical protein
MRPNLSKCERFVGTDLYLVKVDYFLHSKSMRKKVYRIKKRAGLRIGVMRKIVNEARSGTNGNS